MALNVRAFIDGHMVRLRIDAQATEGARLRDLLKQLSREGAIDAAVARSVLKATRGITVLHNGQRLPMPEGAKAPLADGDELSVLTPMAGG